MRSSQGPRGAGASIAREVIAGDGAGADRGRDRSGTADGGAKSAAQHCSVKLGGLCVRLKGVE